MLILKSLHLILIMQRLKHYLDLNIKLFFLSIFDNVMKEKFYLVIGVNFVKLVNTVLRLIQNLVLNALNMLSVLEVIRSQLIKGFGDFDRTRPKFLNA